MFDNVPSADGIDVDAGVDSGAESIGVVNICDS